MGTHRRDWVAGVSLLLLLCGAMPCQSAEIEKLADGKIRPSGVPGLEEAYLPIVFPSSHAANLLALPNGDLLCTYFSGRWEGESGVAIVVARLAHGSRQWDKPSIAAHKEGWSFQNPVLFSPPGGPLWLIHTSQGAGAGQSHSHMFYLTSSDNGRTWSEPKLLFSEAGAFDRQRLVVAVEEWLLPMYFTPSRGITTNAGSNYSVVQVSRDRGRTWKTCPIPKSGGLVQPDVVQLGPGKFLAFFRSRYADWVYKSESKDGCAWTAPE
ncbi:MAG: exo-alpha-sialidase, partial [Bryobacteraceae bacterium]